MAEQLKDFIGTLETYKKGGWGEKPFSQNAYIIRYFSLYIDGSYGDYPYGQDGYNWQKRIEKRVHELYQKGISKPAQKRALRSMAISNFTLWVQAEFGLNRYKMLKALRLVLSPKQIEALNKKLVVRIKDRFNPKYY